MSCHYNKRFHVRSNSIPLDRKLPDLRNDQCKAIVYPANMPTVSVIIIFYNEPLSSLLRNVMSVINRTPPDLLGEIVLGECGCECLATLLGWARLCSVSAGVSFFCSSGEIVLD